jgi:hypothetical protein
VLVQTFRQGEELSGDMSRECQSGDWRSRVQPMRLLVLVGIVGLIDEGVSLVNAAFFEIRLHH